MVDAIGKNAALVEYGSGSSEKTRILLDALHARRTLAAYVPIDISEAFLRETAAGLRDAYPGLPDPPVAADYTRPFDAAGAAQPRPLGSSCSSPARPSATSRRARPRHFLAHVATDARRRRRALVGVDQWKDADVLRVAYDDPEGVTAAFNLNLLRRINRELDGDADLDAWAHRRSASTTTASGSRCTCGACATRRLTVLGEPFAFRAGRDDPHRELPQVRPRRPGALAEAAGLVRQPPVDRRAGLVRRGAVRCPRPDRASFDGAMTKSKKAPRKILGVDIGGSGIKGAPVQTRDGTLISERYRIPTPQPATPKAVAETVHEIMKATGWKKPIGCTVPGRVVRRRGRDGRQHRRRLDRDRRASAVLEGLRRPRRPSSTTPTRPGMAEVKFGAGRKTKGTTLLLTFGTGIGSALFIDGRLVPNTEFGHLRYDKRIAEHVAADSIRTQGAPVVGEVGQAARPARAGDVRVPARRRTSSSSGEA